MAHPQSELYGADRMFLEAVRGMVGAGDEVVVTLPEDGPLSHALADLGVSFEPCPTPVVRKSAMSPRGFLALVLLALTSAPRMWTLLRRTDPDVVYVSTVTAPLWTVMSRAARRRVVVHVHEAQVDVPTAARVVLMAPLFAAHRIIVNSRATALVSAHHYRRLERKMTCIYNGVAVPSRTRPSGEPMHDPLRLVVVGRLSVIKGTDVAVDAVAELVRRGRQVSLLLVGSVFEGYEWFEAQLRRTVDEQDLLKVVQFDGFRPDGWKAFTTCDIALVPSRNESFGNTSIEAQLCGAPVVVTDRQGLPETVDGGRRGEIVPGEDAVALADAVERMADNWDATLARAAMAREECLGLFSEVRYREEVRRVVHDWARSQPEPTRPSRGTGAE
jgi:glycosyltransferase involved in cell wall biosynthesis